MCFPLNVDSSVFLDSNLGGFGGLIRDHTCFFSMVSSRKLVDLDLHAEILDLYHGFKLC
jgi:hypothetical protein